MESIRNFYNSSTSTRPLLPSPELIESVLNYHQFFREVCLSSHLPSETCMRAVVLKPLSCSQHPELLPILQHHLLPPLAPQNALRPRSAFPLALRGTRVVFLLPNAQAILLQARDRGQSHPHTTPSNSFMTRLNPVSLSQGGKGCSRWKSCTGKAAHFWHTGLLVTTRI